MTSANHFEDLHQGRGWLNRAAEMLDSCEDHVSDAEFARAAAAIGNGFIQLAAVEQWAAGRAEDLAEMAADREANREHLDVVHEANRLILARERQELTAVGLRTEALAALDVAALAASGQREKRTEAEARPHDDEHALNPRTDKDCSRGAFLRLECDLQLDGASVLSLHKVGSDVHMRIWHAGADEYAVAVLGRAYRRDVVHALTEFDTSEADRG